MVSMFYQKELYEPWILIQVSSKSDLQGTYKYPNQTWHNVELSGHYDGIPETVLKTRHFEKEKEKQTSKHTKNYYALMLI